MIINILILIIPLIASIFYKNIKNSSVIASIIELFLLLFLYFNEGSPGFFFVDNVSFIFIFIV